MNNYQTIIGVEVHTELSTKHKIFSPAINDINAKPNSNVHPIDLALPGTLPRFNEEVLKTALEVCDGLNMDITKEMHWDRKSYFYLDNPKGYQITQQRTPIGTNGKIILDNGKEIGITFMHMEEDTAKSIHTDSATFLDFNRSGVPLLEIVSDPELRSGDETREYLEKLRDILLYLEASDCKMNEGSLRVDVNISVRPYGMEKLNTKVEIKNLNSFSNVVLAIEDEVKNQIKAYSTGGKIVSCTKRFNESSKKVEMQRIKEGVIDYRYIQEPDLPEIILTDSYIKESIANRNKLPNEIKKEVIDSIKLSEKELKSLMVSPSMTKFFLECVQAGVSAKSIFNYLTVNISEVINKEKIEFEKMNLAIDDFIEIENKVKEGLISSAHVKKIIPILCKEDTNVLDIIEKHNLKQIIDPEVILGFITEVLDSNQDSIDLYKSGKDKAFGFMVGQAMKVSKGQANPVVLNKILKNELEKR